MTYADRIRQAKNPQEAMLVIAEGIDEVLAARPVSDSSEWGSWGGGGNNSTEAVTPQPDYDQDFYEKIDVGDKDPRIGILNHSGYVIGSGQIDKVTDTGDGIVVELPPVGPARRAMRRALAEAIDLPGFFPPIIRSTPEAVEQILHSYELGGPLWLYANRITPDKHDIFQQLPPAAMSVMVADVAEDDQRQAWEFQRDILKDIDDEGATLGIARDNLNGVLDGPRVGLGD